MAVADADQKLRLLGRCPACGRWLALWPAGWVRTCLHYVMLRARRYRCRFCGHEEVRFPHIKGPWVKPVGPQEKE